MVKNNNQKFENNSEYLKYLINLIGNNAISIDKSILNTIHYSQALLNREEFGGKEHIGKSGDIEYGRKSVKKEIIKCIEELEEACKKYGIEVNQVTPQYSSQSSVESGYGSDKSNQFNKRKSSQDSKISLGSNKSTVSIETSMGLIKLKENKHGKRVIDPSSIMDAFQKAHDSRLKDIPKDKNLEEYSNRGETLNDIKNSRKEGYKNLIDQVKSSMSKGSILNDIENSEKDFGKRSFVDNLKGRENIDKGKSGGR
jgi:hypothetical protein